MKSREILIQLAIILLAASISFAVPATFFKENSQSSESTDPLFIGVAFEFTADDGTKFYVQEIDYKYREQKPYYKSYGRVMNIHIMPITRDHYWKQRKYTQDFVSYAILCEDKDQILDFFKLHKDFFKRDDAKYELKISKDKGYENITTYSFNLKYTFLDYEDDLESGGEIVVTSEFWADKKHNKYCGSLEYPPFPLMPKYFNDTKLMLSSGYIVHIGINRDELNEYYFCVADYYLEIIDGYIDEARQKIANDEVAYVDDVVRNIMQLIRECDNGTWKNKNKEFEMFENKNVIIFIKQTLNDYTQYIDVKISEFEKQLLNGYRLSEEEQQALEHKPKFENQLPTTEEELKEYIEWMRVLHRTYADKIYDYNGIEIKFELIPGGLKATSAGLDRIFGNEDDIVFVREFK